MYLNEPGFLLKYFHCEIKKNKDLSSDMYYTYNKQLLGESEYYLCLIHTHSGSIIDYHQYDILGSNSVKIYLHYLLQLPNLSFQNVAFFYKLINLNEDYDLLQNAFQIPDNYPSEYAKILLAETYGYILYKYQLQHLLMTVLPSEETNYESIVKFYYDLHGDCYRSDKNVSGKWLTKLESASLPDGCKFLDILLNYTFKCKKDTLIGFLGTPYYSPVYNFIKNVQYCLSKKETEDYVNYF